MKVVQAVSMWTKHGFPAERVDKLMESDKAVFHELIHTNPPFDHIPPQSVKAKIKVPAAQ